MICGLLIGLLGLLKCTLGKELVQNMRGFHQLNNYWFITILYAHAFNFFQLVRIKRNSRMIQVI